MQLAAGGWMHAGIGYPPGRKQPALVPGLAGLPLWHASPLFLQYILLEALGDVFNLFTGGFDLFCLDV
jgi:hypothetical protein